MAEELGERTEQPTGRKLSRARSEGNIAKSPDFSAAVELSGEFLAIVILGPGLVAGLTAMLRVLLEGSAFGAPQQADWLDHLLQFTAQKAAYLLLPFLGIIFVIAFAAQFLQVGWLWTLKPLRPRLDRLNPLNGVRRLLGKASAAKLAVNVVKLAVVGAVAVSCVARSYKGLAALPALGVVPALAMVGNMIIRLLLWVLVLFLVIGICDFLFQRWNRVQKLKMTKQEIKEEIKQVEGDLQAKARRLNLARTLVYQKMLQKVSTADVVVTNPTHFAVALKYEADKMHAPTVVAKGADYMAFRIRDLAREAGVPIVEKPPLARGLYFNVEVGRAIAPEFYQAVAEILAYVYRLKAKAA